MTVAQEGGRLSALRLTPKKYSWYSFLLEAESTPGPLCGGKDYVKEIFQWHHLGWNQPPADLLNSTLTTELPRSPHSVQYGILINHEGPGKACSTHGTWEICKVYLGNMKWINYWEDLRVDGMALLELVLKETGCKGVEWSDVVKMR